MKVSTFIHHMFVIHAGENESITKKKSNKKALVVINIVPFDSHSEQCFCSAPKGLSKFKFSVSLSKISKKVGSSNSIQLEGALDEITTEFVLASAKNLVYFALELVDEEKMLNRMKFGSNGSVSIQLLIRVFPDFHWQICMFSKQLSASKPYLEYLPPLLTVGNIEMFLNTQRMLNYVQVIMTLMILYFTKYHKVHI